MSQNSSQRPDPVTAARIKSINEGIYPELRREQLEYFDSAHFQRRIHVPVEIPVEEGGHTSAPTCPQPEPQRAAPPTQTTEAATVPLSPTSSDAVVSALASSASAPHKPLKQQIAAAITNLTHSIPHGLPHLLHRKPETAEAAAVRAAHESAAKAGPTLYHAEHDVPYSPPESPVADGDDVAAPSYHSESHSVPQPPASHHSEPHPVPQPAASHHSEPHSVLQPVPSYHNESHSVPHPTAASHHSEPHASVTASAVSQRQDYDARAPVTAAAYDEAAALEAAALAYATRAPVPPQRDAFAPFTAPTPGVAPVDSDEDSEADDAAQCTFHPQINPRSRSLVARYRARMSQHYSRPSADPDASQPCEESEDAASASSAAADSAPAAFDRLYKNAALSQRARKDADALRRYEQPKPRPARPWQTTSQQEEQETANESGTVTQESGTVFGRLYADAVRYNDTRAERERRLEERRKVERGLLPPRPGQNASHTRASRQQRGARAPRNGSSVATGDVDTQRSTQDAASCASAATSPTGAEHGETRKAPSPSPRLFERLSRPTHVVKKRVEVLEAAKQQAEEVHQRQRRELRDELKAMTLLTWNLPAPSFTIENLRHHNQLYAQC